MNQLLPAVRIISIIAGFVLILGISICTSVSQTTTNIPVRLTPAMFTEYEFTLISDKDYCYYWFKDDGWVSETFGQNNALVGLDEGWKIEHGNTLVFLGVSPRVNVENPVRSTLQFKSFGKKMVVTMDGQKFKRSKFKRPKDGPIEVK